MEPATRELLMRLLKGLITGWIAAHGPTPGERGHKHMHGYTIEQSFALKDVIK